MRERLQKGSTEFRNRKEDWVRFYKASPSKYEMRALIAVYENHGDEMLAEVLAALGLGSSADLVKDAAGKQ